MTVVLAYLSPVDRLIAVGLLVGVALAVAVAVITSPPPAEPPAHVDEEPRVIPRTGPVRPYDWSIDEARFFTPADVARLYDLDPASLGLPRPHAFADLPLDVAAHFLYDPETDSLWQNLPTRIRP